MQVRPFTWLALSFFGYYCAYGVFLPLFPAWLKTQSYSEESIGLLLACAYIFRFSGGILFSGLIKRVSLLVNGLRYLGVASAITMALIGLMSHNFWLLFIGLALYSMVNAAGMPIGDSLASTWQQQIHLDYGKARLIGSFAFVVGVMVFGYFVGLVGEQYITWMITGILVFYSIVQLLHPNPMPQDEPQSAVENEKVFLAGVVEKEGKLVTNGGRVLCATALGKNVFEAQQKALKLAEQIQWTGRFYRRDIGYRAVEREQQK